MGVHDADKATYTKIKKLLGIPEDEPIFVFRGQDKLYTPVLARYRNMRASAEQPDAQPTPEWLDNMTEAIDAGATWQRNHEDRVKLPD